MIFLVCPAEGLPFEGQFGGLSDSILTGSRVLESISSSIPLKVSLELVRAVTESFGFAPRLTKEGLPWALLQETSSAAQRRATRATGNSAI